MSGFDRALPDWDYRAEKHIYEEPPRYTERLASDNQLTEDDVLEATIEAEPEDVVDLGESFEIVCDPAQVVAVRQAVQAAGLDYDSAEVTFVAGEGIKGVELTVVAQVENISAEDFARIAEEAKAGCPVSQALSVDITLDASLA